MTEQAQPTMRRIARSPTTFDDSLRRLVDDFVERVLPSPEIVAIYHRQLLDYSDGEDPLFLIRNMGGTERCRIYTTSSGGRFKATDNAPAWWMHYALFHNIRIPDDEFSHVIATIPARMFEIKLPESINTAGWHVAHIADVKDRNVDFLSWSRAELSYRFLRNVHPCNCFFVPKPDWQKWGADQRVIGFFASMYAERYRDVWPEFLERARIDSSQFLVADGSIRYHYGVSRSIKSEETPGTRSGVRTYEASRLLFKRDIIEALHDDERFRIVTSDAVYEMSKADFHRVFHHVTLTLSWSRDRYYSYSKVPAKAEEFLIRSVKLP